MEWMPHAATPDRIGMRELRPGIWVGLRSHLSPQCELRAPCWIGEDVHIGPWAIVGPGAILESRTFVDAEAEIVESVVGASTLIGKSTEVRHSIVEGPTLVNWRLNSCVRVRDAFLLSGLEPYSSRFERPSFVGRFMALVVLLLLSPFALIAALKARRRGTPAFRALLAARPCPVTAEIVPGDTVVYYELADVDGLLGRWPQLWSVVKGDFAWVGNRPLNPHQAENLANDYERLWLAAPIGLVSLADTERCFTSLSDEARAHASYYAAGADWRLNMAILLRMLFLMTVGVPWSRHSESIAQSLRNLRIGERPSVRE
jgi:Bacterial sugar transferase